MTKIYSRYQSSDHESNENESESDESKENHRPQRNLKRSRKSTKTTMRESENYEFDLDENARDSFQGDSEDHQPSKRQRRRPSRFSSESQEPDLICRITKGGAALVSSFCIFHQNLKFHC